MPKHKRTPIPPTDDWPILQTRFTWPEQLVYELIRPVVLFGQTPAAGPANRRSGAHPLSPGRPL